MTETKTFTDYLLYIEDKARKAGLPCCPPNRDPCVPNYTEFVQEIPINETTLKQWYNYWDIHDIVQDESNAVAKKLFNIYWHSFKCQETGFHNKIKLRILKANGPADEPLKVLVGIYDTNVNLTPENLLTKGHLNLVGQPHEYNNKFVTVEFDSINLTKDKLYYVGIKSWIWQETIDPDSHYIHYYGIKNSENDEWGNISTSYRTTKKYETDNLDYYNDEFINRISSDESSEVEPVAQIDSNQFWFQIYGPRKSNLSDKGLGIIAYSKSLIKEDLVFKIINNDSKQIAHIDASVLKNIKSRRVYRITVKVNIYTTGHSAKLLIYACTTPSKDGDYIKSGKRSNKLLSTTTGSNTVDKDLTEELINKPNTYYTTTVITGNSIKLRHVKVSFTHDNGTKGDSLTVVKGTTLNCINNYIYIEDIGPAIHGLNYDYI
jgi:hypothetical protein